MTTLTHAELEQLWNANGGDPLSADRAAAIAQAESGGCQYAKAGPTDDRPVQECVYRQTTQENSYGLWQINRDAHPTYTAASLYTLGGNAVAAVEISQNGLDFTPWSTYKDGSYLQYMTNPSTTGPAQPAGPLSTGSPGSASSTHQVEQAWTSLMRTLAITVPAHLDKIAAARTRIRAAVR